MKDPYVVLGVSKTATQDEIKKAYKGLAKKYHPDLNPGNKEAEIKFKDLTQAFELVGSEEARTKFDRGETGEAFGQGGGRRQGPSYYNTQQNHGRYSEHFGEDLDEDFFEHLFGGARRGGGYRRQYKGEDQLYRMEVEFREAVLGAERVITLPNGKRLQVKIPPGVESGQKLRFAQQGGPGAGGAPPGDALVEITVKPLEGFIRKGNDIETELPISFMEAILGAEVSVPTLEGEVLLKIPPGVTTGSKLRIKGKGVAKSTPGNMLVTLKVMTPKEVNPQLQEKIRQLQGDFSFNPR
jgi:DnaJ-class molecular chaperone